MYNAIVATLTNVREHPNADRLKLATVLGSQVVVGLDSVEGQLGIYFPTDGKISQEYGEQNDLFPVYSGGVKISGGMFDPKNRRVRAQNLRSVKSDGYFADLDSVAYTGVKMEDLYEGYQFDTLNEHLICEKYYTPQTLKAMKGGTKATRKKNIMFHEHVDTEQYAYKADQVIVPGSICWITEKLHGTSHRIGNVIEEVEGKTRWYHKLFKREPKVTRGWKLIHGTRRVVLGDRGDTTSYYGTDEFRYTSTSTLEENLRKGEVVYGEIVGYVNEERLVMGETSTKDLRKDKEFKALFGGNVPEQMRYTYNCIPGESEFYIYRITQVDEDGHVVELSWPQVKARCGELGVKHVPDIGDPMVINEEIVWVDEDADGYDGELFGAIATGKAELQYLDAFVDAFQQGVSTLDPTTIREGVVVRVDRPDGTTHFLKQKQYYFKVLEGIAKADESYVDTEEAS